MLIQILLLGSSAAFAMKQLRDQQQRQLIHQRGKSPHPQTRKTAKTRHHVTSNTPSFIDKSKSGALALKKIFEISLTSGKQRRQQAKQMIAYEQDEQTIKSEQKLDRNINFSLGLMSISLIGSRLFSPLIPAAAVGSLYFFYPAFQRLVHNLKEKRIPTELLEVVSVISLLTTGYFFLANVVTFLHLLNLKSLTRSEQNAQRQLLDNFSQKRQAVWILRGKAEIRIPLQAVQKQDILVVNTGEFIPVDGTITKGSAGVDQHHLTGEFQAAEKKVGDKVLATSRLLTGRIELQVGNTGTDTKAAKIGQILQHGQAYKESIRIKGKHIADGFVTPTLIISGLTLPLFGPSSAMAVLWSGYAHNMNLFGPISVLNYLHIMADNGILIKDGRSLELLQQVDTVVFDKTGALPLAQPNLSRLHSFGSFDKDRLLTYAAAAEYQQIHPIAKAIRAAAEERGLNLPKIKQAAYGIGDGVKVRIDSSEIRVGNARYMHQESIPLTKEVLELESQSDSKRHSLIYVAVNQILAGALELQAEPHPEARKIIQYLKAQNISPYMISGDHEQSTRQLAKELDIDHYFPETLHDQKAKIIKKLRKEGKFVAYISDGINDGAALRQANVSISLRGATTVASDAAQIILLGGNLNKLEPLFETAKSFEANIKTNAIASMIPGFICLTGIFFFHMGVVGGVVLYFTSKLAGLSNAMLPLIKHENSIKGKAK